MVLIFYVIGSILQHIHYGINRNEALAKGVSLTPRQQFDSLDEKWYPCGGFSLMKAICTLKYIFWNTMSPCGSNQCTFLDTPSTNLYVQRTFLCCASSMTSIVLNLVLGIVVGFDFCVARGFWNSSAGKVPCVNGSRK